MAKFTASMNGVTVTFEVPYERLGAIRRTYPNSPSGQDDFDAFLNLLQMRVREVAATVSTALIMPKLAAAVLVGTAGEGERLNETLQVLSTCV